MSVLIGAGEQVVLFHSVHRVMAAEKALKAAGLPVLLIPAPRELAADCGLALRFADGQQAAVLTELGRQGLSPAERYAWRDGHFVRLDDGEGAVTAADSP